MFPVQLSPCPLLHQCFWHRSKEALDSQPKWFIFKGVTCMKREIMVNILNLRLLVLLGPDYPRLTERLCITDLCCTGNTKCGWQCVVLGPCVVGVPGQVFTAPFVDWWHLNAWMNVSCLFIDYYFKIFISDAHCMLNFLMQVVYKGKYIYLIIEIYYFIAQLISQSKFSL